MRGPGFIPYNSDVYGFPGIIIKKMIEDGEGDYLKDYAKNEEHAEELYQKMSDEIASGKINLMECGEDTMYDWDREQLVNYGKRGCNKNFSVKG